MTKAELKEKRRANRRIKRQKQHQERMAQAHERWHEDEFERLDKKNQYGKKDLTAYYGILNAERPRNKRVYGNLI